MSIEKYRGYMIEGFAKPAGSGEFASLGRVTKDRRVIMESEVLGLYERNENAQGHAILWAQDYVDRLENPH
ncbi:hypothetical protein D8I24_2783 (plasmid) [Cupriavidus necator H850]|uniref:hypothetical protein n=1 Tax=Cupriavidus necator TaxID=106590 RepID=UPI00129E8B13|nr:hypothetical protein [Cupriavidus necator]KAI3603846.1 hypothetical protein D8I24_2783 [Cupriavidus necator H850]